MLFVARPRARAARSPVLQARAGRANKAIIVYPDALALANQGNQTGWNLSATGNDVAFFDALLKEVSGSLCVDNNRIFSAGHSFGAMMTNALGCYRGNVLRAIAPVAGGPPGRGNVTCTGEVAAWLAHGDNDATVNFTTSGIPSRDFWLPRNGARDISGHHAIALYLRGCRDAFPPLLCSPEQPRLAVVRRNRNLAFSPELTDFSAVPYGVTDAGSARSLRISLDRCRQFETKRAPLR